MTTNEPSPPMTPQVANIYKATSENITFSKKQQWTITNYTVLIYAALFGLGRGMQAMTKCESIALTALAVATFICSTWLLIQIQRDMGRYRVRLEKMHGEWLNEYERNVMDIRPYVSPTLRGVWFLVALIGVSAIGAIISTYSLWR